MKHKKMLLGAIATLLVVSTVVAVIVYELTIPMSMKLETSYELKLVRADGTTEILNYAWALFGENQEKMMFELDDYSARILNLGNKDTNVTWVSTCPVEWNLRLEASGSPLGTYLTWNSGTLKEFGYVDSFGIFIKVYLQEVNATAGLDYSFNLIFQIVE